MYTTRQGQAWDQIAKEVYGDEKYTDYLMQSNPQYLDIFVFPYGIGLKTPELPQDRKDIPLWR